MILSKKIFFLLFAPSVGRHLVIFREKASIFCLIFYLIFYFYLWFFFLENDRLRYGLKTGKTRFCSKNPIFAKIDENRLKTLQKEVFRHKLCQKCSNLAETFTKCSFYNYEVNYVAFWHFGKLPPPLGMPKRLRCSITYFLFLFLQTHDFKFLNSTLVIWDIVLVKGS